MSKIDDVFAWLQSNREFKAGVDLYEKHGDNSFLKRRFRDGGEHLAAQLHEELKKMVPSSRFIRVVSSPKEHSQVPPSSPGSTPNEPTTTSPESLAAEKSRLFHQRAKLSNSLADFSSGDDAGRKQVVDQINLISKKMTDIRKVQLGATPGTSEKSPEKKDPDLPSSEVELIQLRNNYRSRLSREKAKLKRFSPDGKSPDAQKLEKARQEMDRFDVLLQSINEKLNHG